MTTVILPTDHPLHHLQQAEGHRSIDTQITIAASAAIPPTPENGETDEEHQAREAREQKARDERRWALTRMIVAHVERLCVCLDMLVDADAKDRAALAALAQRMTAEVAQRVLGA